MAPRTRRRGGAEAAAAEYEAALKRRRDVKLKKIAIIVTVILAIATLADYFSRKPELTIPRVRKNATCYPKSETYYASDLLMCRGASEHNKVVLGKIMETAQQGLLIKGDLMDIKRWKASGGSESLATAIVEYSAGLAMRGKELYSIHKVVHDFLMHSLKILACTKLVDIGQFTGPDDVYNSTFRVPEFICSEAVFLEPPTGDSKHFQPTELMLTAQRMAILFSLLGSDYHEGTVAYMMAMPLNSTKGDTHNRPMFGYFATQVYQMEYPMENWFELMTAMWKMPKRDQRILGLIISELFGNFNRMLASDTDGNSTWHETFLNAIPSYNPRGYWKATRRWYEQIWDIIVDRVKRINESPIKASIKHSLYLTAFLWLSLYLLDDYVPSFSLSTTLYKFPIITFIVSEGIIWSAVSLWNSCPLFVFFPELQRRE